MKKTILIAFLVLCSSANAGFTTAIGLLEQCESGSIRECDLFIEGVVGGMRAEQSNKLGALRGIYEYLMDNLSGQDAENVKKGFALVPALCIYPNLSSETIRQVVVGYAKSHPQKPETSAAWLVFDALQAKYGCNLHF